MSSATERNAMEHHGEADFGDNFFGEEDEAPVDMEVVREGMKLVPLSDMGFGEPDDDVMDVNSSMREHVLNPLSLILPDQVHFQGASKDDIGAGCASYPQKGNLEATAAKVAAEVAADVVTSGAVAEAGPRPDFSMWTAEDDLLLKNAMEAGAAVEALARGAVKFSQRYTVRELRERWRALLYDPEVSEMAAIRMQKCEIPVNNPGKLSYLKRLKDSQDSLKKRKANSVRTHYYKMRKRIDAECVPDHLLPSLELDAEDAVTQMVRLLAVGGVGAVVQALPSAGNESLHEDSSFVSLMPQEASQLQVLESISGHVIEISSQTEPKILEPMSDLKPVEDAAMKSSPHDPALDKHAEEEPIAGSDVKFQDAQLEDSQPIQGKVDSTIIHTSERSESECVSNEVNETGVDDDLASCNKPLILPGHEHMICVLNTEDTDIPSPPPGSASRSPSLFSSMFSPTDIRGDENESSMSGGAYEGTAGIKLSANDLRPLDPENAVGVASAVKEEPTSDVLQSGNKHLLDPHSFKPLGHKVISDVCVQIKDKEAVENAGVECKNSRLGLTSQGALDGEFNGASVDLQSRSQVGVSPSDNELALPSQIGQLEHPLYFEDQSADALTTCQENSEECLESEEEMPSFSDVESMILDMDLDPAFDEDASARAESRRLYKKFRKTLMRLEQGANAAFERALTRQGAIAMLYGRHSRHYIRKNEVLLGRMTQDNFVDVDLGREGRANKVSRKQATVKLKEDGVFYLKNLGRRALSVNNISIPNGQHASLGSNCLIERTSKNLIKAQIQLPPPSALQSTISGEDTIKPPSSPAAAPSYPSYEEAVVDLMEITVSNS